MKGQLTVIKANGEIVRTELTSPPGLEMLKKAVGGWIECIPYFEKFEGKPCVAFCNEEGKLNDLPFNEVASALWFEAGITNDVLVGDVAIVTGDKKLLRSL